MGAKPAVSLPKPTSTGGRARHSNPITPMAFRLQITLAYLLIQTSISAENVYFIDVRINLISVDVGVKNGALSACN